VDERDNVADWREFAVRGIRERAQAHALRLRKMSAANVIENWRMRVEEGLLSEDLGCSSVASRIILDIPSRHL